MTPRASSSAAGRPALVVAVHAGRFTHYVRGGAGVLVESASLCGQFPVDVSEERDLWTLGPGESTCMACHAEACRMRGTVLGADYDASETEDTP